MATVMRTKYIKKLMVIASDAGTPRRIKKKLIKIGKDASCDILVKGFMIGKTAATVSKRPKGYYLSYVSGMAKPKVNDVAVKESVLLNESDIIELGSIKMQFIYKS